MMPWVRGSKHGVRGGRRAALHLGMACAFLLAVPSSALEPALAERVAQRIRTEVPGVTVSVADDVNLNVEQASVAKVGVNLDNVRRSCADATACEEAIGALVAALKQGFGNFVAVPQPQQLRIRVTGRSLIDQIKAKLEAAPPKERASNQPIARELTKELWLLLVADDAYNMRTLTRGIADRMGKTDAELFALAVDNLRRTLPAPEFCRWSSTPASEFRRLRRKNMTRPTCCFPT